MTGSYYLQGDQVRVARAGHHAHLGRPAGGRQHVPGGPQVRGGEARAQPEPYLLTVGHGGGGHDERQLAAPGLDPRVRAASPDPVRRDEAPGPGPAPAVTQSPMGPNALMMSPQDTARTASRPISQRQFQVNSTRPGRRTRLTAASRLDIRLGSFGP